MRSVMAPVSPLRARTMTNTKPLNAFLVCDPNAVKIEARPHELARHKRVLVLSGKLNIGRLRPTREIQIVRTDLKIGLVGLEIEFDRKEIFAARRDRRGGFAAKNRDVRVGFVEIAVFAWLVIVAENIDGFLESVEARVVEIVARRERETSCDTNPRPFTAVCRFRPANGKRWRGSTGKDAEFNRKWK